MRLRIHGPGDKESVSRESGAGRVAVGSERDGCGPVGAGAGERGGEENLPGSEDWVTGIAHRLLPRSRGRAAPASARGVPSHILGARTDLVAHESRPVSAGRNRGAGPDHYQRRALVAYSAQHATGNDPAFDADSCDPQFTGGGRGHELPDHELAGTGDAAEDGLLGRHSRRLCHAGGDSYAAAQREASSSPGERAGGAVRREPGSAYSFCDFVGPAGFAASGAGRE